jgi:hypothetical protein
VGRCRGSVANRLVLSIFDDPALTDSTHPAIFVDLPNKREYKTFVQSYRIICPKTRIYAYGKV